eukprot:4784763-Karenia_brevis.AAC.1
MLRIPISCNIPSIDHPSDLVESTTSSCLASLRFAGFEGADGNIQQLGVTLIHHMPAHDAQHL